MDTLSSSVDIRTLGARPPRAAREGRLSAELAVNLDDVTGATNAEALSSTAAVATQAPANFIITSLLDWRAIGVSLG